jgi:hypothetical protein
MKTKLFAIGVGALVAYAIANAWPELVRYRRMMAM